VQDLTPEHGCRGNANLELQLLKTGDINGLDNSVSQGFLHHSVTANTWL
jgi:hypothetical protein